MIEIIALGTGSAFSLKNWQTNFVIKSGKKNLLVDCGSDIRHSLTRQGLSYLDIDAMYVSHLHGDHASGVDYIAFCTYFDSRYHSNRLPVPDWKGPKIRPILFCERQLMRDLWDHSWRGSLEGLEGIDATIDTYFDTRPVVKNNNFTFGGIVFDIVQSIHISAKYSIVDSYGLMFTDPENGKRIYITTDVQFAPETSLKAYYKESDLIIHDCETMYKSGVHAHYDSLVTLTPDIKSKMILVHYQDNVIDDWDSWENKAISDGFIGFGKPGTIYKTTPPSACVRVISETSNIKMTEFKPPESCRQSLTTPVAASRDELGKIR